MHAQLPTKHATPRARLALACAAAAAAAATALRALCGRIGAATSAGDAQAGRTTHVSA
jgi:hypothetical protein